MGIGGPLGYIFHLQGDSIGGGSGVPVAPCSGLLSLGLLQSSSFSSITDSTMSLNIITVTLNMGESPQPLRHALPQPCRLVSVGPYSQSLPSSHSHTGHWLCPSL